MIGAFEALGLPAALSGRLISLVCAALVVFCLSRWVASRFSGRERLLVLAWVVTIPSWTVAANRVCSEALFLALAVPALLLASSGSRGRADTVRLLVCGALVGLATCVRWTGAALVVSCVLGILARGVRRVFPDGLWFVAGLAPAVLFLAVWRLNTPDGPRIQSDAAVLEALSIATSGFFQGLIVPALVAGILVLVAIREAGAWRPDRPFWFVHASYLIVGVTMLLIARMTFRTDGLGLRTLTPFVPSAVLLAIAVVHARNPRVGGTGRVSPLLFASGFVAAIGVHAAVMADTLTRMPPVGRATLEIRLIGRTIPSDEAIPVLTTNPMVAVERPDLLWRTPLAGPNGPTIPVREFLRIHPEHHAGLVVFARELADGWARPIRPLACTWMLCLGRLPDGALTPEAVQRDSSSTR